MLLGLHRIVAQHATGSGRKLRELLEWETIALTTVLDRFAPVPFYDELALWAEHDDETY